MEKTAEHEIEMRVGVNHHEAVIGFKPPLDIESRQLAIASLDASTITDLMFTRTNVSFFRETETETGKHHELHLPRQRDYVAVGIAETLRQANREIIYDESQNPVLLTPDTKLFD